MSGPERDEDIWFAPKRYGYGSGLPLRREGWIALLAYAAGMIVLALASGPVARAGPALLAITFGAMAILTLWFGRLCARHTRGGWRWRWGKEETD